jgi:hypothetical protein
VDKQLNGVQNKVNKTVNEIVKPNQKNK